MRAAPTSAPAWIVVAGLVAGPTACAVNHATGKHQLSFVSESQEIQMGQQYAQQVVR